MTTAPAAPPAAKASKHGGYIVLESKSHPDDLPADWSVVNFSTEKSASAAIRAVVSKLGVDDQSGTFVAIPTRSWKPVKVSARTETKLVVEEVK